MPRDSFSWEQTRKHEKWHWADLLVLNIVAMSSFSAQRLQQVECDVDFKPARMTRARTQTHEHTHTQTAEMGEGDRWRERWDFQHHSKIVMIVSGQRGHAHFDNLLAGLQLRGSYWPRMAESNEQSITQPTQHARSPMLLLIIILFASPQEHFKTVRLISTDAKWEQRGAR